MTTIALVGDQKDPGLDQLQSTLCARGCQVLRIDLGLFPENISLGLGPDAIVADSQQLLDCSAAYIGRPEVMSPICPWVPGQQEWPSLQETIGEKIRQRQEARSVRASLLALLAERLPVVNHPTAHRQQFLACSQLRLLAQSGLPVTDFVSGNDLEQMAYFVDQHQQQCRVRRLLQSPWQEQVADFAYLKEHHLDLDRHPVLLRATTGSRRLAALVVGKQCLGTVTGAPNTPKQGPEIPEVSAHAVKACRLTGATVGLVHFELADSDDSPRITGIEHQIDLALLHRAGIDVYPPLAALLQQTAGEQQRIEQPQIQQPQPGPRRDKPCIGIAGQTTNMEVHALARAIEERGAEALPVELPLFPDRRALHETSAGGRIGQVDLGQLDALFLRTTGVLSPLPSDEEPDPTAEQWQNIYPRYRVFPQDQGECFYFKYAVLETLGRRIPVINPPIGQEVHRIKVWQLFSLQRAGFPVPPTVAGNNEEMCRAFVEQQGGEDRVVLKPLAGIFKTCLLSEVGLKAALESGPVILQKYVMGDTIRAYIVGGKLVGAGKVLHKGTSVDSSVDQQGVEPVELSKQTVVAGWGAAQHLQLSWTGMDFMREKETGEHYILECNAAAMFVGFSNQTGFDVPGALADHLIALSGQKK